MSRYNEDRRQLRKKNFDTLAEILYIAGLSLERQSWKDLTYLLARHFTLHNKMFDGKRFLQMAGYFDED